MIIHSVLCDAQNSFGIKILLLLVSVEKRLAR